MSDASRKQFTPKLVLLRPDQQTFIQNDADNRYPERHGPKQVRRNFNPALRDGIDFWQAHYHLFLTYIATRGNSATDDNGGEI